MDHTLITYQLHPHIDYPNTVCLSQLHVNCMLLNQLPMDSSCLHAHVSYMFQESIIISVHPTAISGVRLEPDSALGPTQQA